MRKLLATIAAIAAVSITAGLPAQMGFNHATSPMTAWQDIGTPAGVTVVKSAGSILAVNGTASQQVVTLRSPLMAMVANQHYADVRVHVALKHRDNHLNPFPPLLISSLAVSDGALNATTRMLTTGGTQTSCVWRSGVAATNCQVQVDVIVPAGRTWVVENPRVVVMEGATVELNWTPTSVTGSTAVGKTYTNGIQVLHWDGLVMQPGVPIAPSHGIGVMFVAPGITIPIVNDAFSFTSTPANIAALAAGFWQAFDVPPAPTPLSLGWVVQ